MVARCIEHILYILIKMVVKLYGTYFIYFSSNGCQDVQNTYYIFQFKWLSRCIEHILYISVQMVVKMYGTHFIYLCTNGCHDVQNTYYIFQLNGCQDV